MGRSIRLMIFTRNSKKTKKKRKRRLTSGPRDTGPTKALARATRKMWVLIKNTCTMGKVIINVDSGGFWKKRESGPMVLKKGHYIRKLFFL